MDWKAVAEFSGGKSVDGYRVNVSKVIKKLKESSNTGGNDGAASTASPSKKRNKASAGVDVDEDEDVNKKKKQARVSKKAVTRKTRPRVWQLKVSNGCCRGGR